MSKVVVFTQNVDGLHRKAGSSDLIEIHGNLQELRCTVCDHGETVDDLAGRELPRTRVSVTGRAGETLVEITASDTSAMRAALNSYLECIRITEDIERITK